MWPLRLRFRCSAREGLHAFEFSRKQAEPQLVIEVFGDDLRIFVDFKHDVFCRRE